jgi:hypothetical protein
VESAAFDMASSETTRRSMARDGLHSLCETLSLSEIPFYSHWRLAVGVFELNFGLIFDRFWVCGSGSADPLLQCNIPSIYSKNLMRLSIEWCLDSLRRWLRRIFRPLRTSVLMDSCQSLQRFHIDIDRRQRPGNPAPVLPPYHQSSCHGKTRG